MLDPLITRTKFCSRCGHAVRQFKAGGWTMAGALCDCTNEPCTSMRKDPNQCGEDGKWWIPDVQGQVRPPTEGED